MTNSSIARKTGFNVKTILYITLALSFIVRCILAYLVEFGNDEVYYVNYALYPELSHFDHPPFVGWLIQLTTLNLWIENEFFIRLGSILIGVVNTYIMFLIGKSLKNELTGLYAALLYTASLYSFVIVGTFIMPDSPQSLFWLLSILLMVRIFNDKEIDRKSKQMMLLLGLTIGLAMLSKYTSAFLWFGAGLYILFFDRKWLSQPALYLSALISLVAFTPVVIWNIANDFITINYHSGRVAVTGSVFNCQTFATEIVGSMFYNNVVNIIIILTALFTYIFRNRFVDKRKFALLIFLSLPIILMFLCFSMFKPTLPHWSAPGYFALLLIAALYFDRELYRDTIIPQAIIASIMLLVIIMTVAVVQIRSGAVNLSKHDSPERIGVSDFSLDMYGYKQLNEKFIPIRQRHIREGIMPTDPVLIGYKWFPTANLDYYVARPNGIKTLTLSPLFEAHKYKAITEKRGGLHEGMNAYFINSSRYRLDVEAVFNDNFDSLKPIDTIKIYRNNHHVMDYVVWYMQGLKNIDKFE